MALCRCVDRYDPLRQERGVLCTARKKPCVCISCSIFTVIVLIVSISLLASSFDNVDEGEACLQYSDYTGVLEDEVVLDPTNKFVGVSSAFTCYPKTIQEIEFTRGGEGVSRVLGTRTNEGLFINLDIHIEYRLVSSEMKLLFLKFGEWDNVVSNVTLVARSTLRNTASRYGGLDYLAGDRGLIAANMKTDLHVAFSPFHLTVSEVNIRSISLSPEFERAFDAVRQVKLAASKALQTREVDITQERRANESSVITLLAQRETTLLNSHAKVTKASLEREAQITAAQTEIITAKLKAESTRATKLTQARSEVNKAQSQRLARLTEARVRNSEQTLAAERSRGVVLIEASTEVERAKAARVAQTTEAQTAFEREKIELQRERDSALTQAQGLLAQAQLARVGALLEEKAKFGATVTREAAREERARTLALIELVKGNATAVSIAASEAANLKEARGQHEAQAQLIKELQTKAGLSEEQAMRFMHLGAVARVASAPDTTLFVDYNKVPMVLEAASSDTNVAATVNAQQ